jgi:ribosomal protein S18 acetylase RimI-like enzyme
LFDNFILNVLYQEWTELNCIVREGERRQKRISRRDIQRPFGCETRHGHGHDDEVDDSTAPLEEIDATFAGFISVDLETTPSAFDWPDRLVVGDFYVRELYRGAALADQLVARAVQFAREDGCEQLVLEVDIDNERALAYYEKLGFEVGKYRMRVPVEEIELDV